MSNIILIISLGLIGAGVTGLLVWLYLIKADYMNKQSSGKSPTMTWPIGVMHDVRVCKCEWCASYRKFCETTRESQAKQDEREQDVKSELYKNVSNGDIKEE